MMPGTALRNAPAINACHVNALPAIPSSITSAAPHTMRPGCYDREVKSGYALLFRTVIKESRHEAVSCELECHGSGDRIQRGHSEDKRAHDGENRTDRETVLPAADKSAEKHRNVHGEQHIAYLRYAAGDHGQYHTERRKHCGESQVFYLLFHFAPRFFIWPSPRLPLHDGRRCVPSRL